MFAKLDLGFADLVTEFSFQSAATSVNQTCMLSCLDMLVDRVVEFLAFVEHVLDGFQVGVISLELLEIEMVAEFAHIAAVAEWARLFFNSIEIGA